MNMKEKDMKEIARETVQKSYGLATYIVSGKQIGNSKYDTSPYTLDQEIRNATSKGLQGNPYKCATKHYQYKASAVRAMKREMAR